MTTQQTNRFSGHSMVAVASATRSDIALAQLILSAAGIPYVAVSDPDDHTLQLLVNPADAGDAAAILS